MRPMADETARERLHHLIDRLPERALEVVGRFLELLAGREANSPEADEPDEPDEPEPWLRELLEQVSPEELAAIHAASEDEAARLIVEHAERRGILIPSEDDSPT